ncbi:unnamed protein product [Caenorhabditis angaria]|uniref:T20D4.11-like domain-containing protein n=1 Tax=Caenorhabditis angaria TaxID=860376 RepID=A0A9P1MVF2_9PELO|nr:unnamed protein product [Caenorhabditis angaria]
MFKFTVFLLIHFVSAEKFLLSERGFNPHLETCGPFGKFQVSACGWYTLQETWTSFKTLFTTLDYSNTTAEELTSTCDQKYACLQNTGCYAERINIRLLDRCSYAAFVLGPFSPCEDKLREMMKNNTETQKMSFCVKEYLSSTDPEPSDCNELTKRIECFAPDVQKFCSPHVYELHQKIQQKRLGYKECVNEEKTE